MDETNASLPASITATPDWFEQALKQAPERTMTRVGGAGIETLTWGEVGRPGLMFLHGNGAHADWWSFIAPFFAAQYRVAAMSWSGMGGSGRRTSYSLDGFVSEVFAVAQATGLVAGSAPPVLVAHSFGGFPAIACAARGGERLRAVILVDVPLMSSAQRKARDHRPRSTRPPQPNRVYPTLDAAVRRFRFAPPQPCENRYIADYIARTSLQEILLPGDLSGGWTWRFDPYLWRDYRMGNPAAELSAARCPLAITWGARSALVKADAVGYMISLAPAGTPTIEIPDAHHHVMVDQPLAFVAMLRGLLAGWP
jgi:pimeloyl-ACP methyl ester carboxylesterase